MWMTEEEIGDLVEEVHHDLPGCEARPAVTMSGQRGVVVIMPGAELAVMLERKVDWMIMRWLADFPKLAGHGRMVDPPAQYRAES